MNDNNPHGQSDADPSQSADAAPLTPGKTAITLKLTQREMKVLDDLAEKKELTKVGVIRQALRLYQLLDARLARGEKVLVEDAANAKMTELVLL